MFHGGLGVLETAIAYVAPEAASIGALIAFRCLYFVVPLALGTTLMIIGELIFERHSARTDNPAQPADETA